MDSAPESAAIADGAHLDELLQHIRAGDADAEVELQRVLYRGARFLIQRRLGRRDVEGEVRSVLKTAIRLVQTDVSASGENLAGVVRNCIQERFGWEARSKGPAIAASSGPNVELAAGILDRMSEVEREALRDYYVRGQEPDSFVKRLHLTRREFRAIRLRARTEFSAMQSQKQNVA